MGRNVTALGLAAKEEKKELKKHAATIHCSNTLSLLQRKVSNALLYHAYKELMLKAEHEISVKQLCKLIGYQGNNHAVIKDALRGLISTIIEWNLIDEQTGADNWTASSIIASVSLQGPLCYYAYSPRMKALLHSPAMFGKIDLVIQSKFRSSYGLALYENCIRYRGLPQTKWLDMELFKKLMGVPSGKYDIFRDFKRRVLDKAVDEVNTYSDLVIATEFIREGRKVIKVRFKLKERAKKMRLGNLKRKASAANNTPLEKKLAQQFGLTKAQIKQLCNTYESQFIEEKIHLIESSPAFLSGKIQNIGGYLLSAIKHNYQSHKGKIAVPLQIDNQDDAHAIQDLKRRVEEIWHAYHDYRETYIQEAIAQLSDDAHQAFMQAFYTERAPAIASVLRLQRNRYTHETVLESPQIKAQLRQFALRELDLISLISLEEFVASLADDKRDAWQQLKSYDPDHPFLRAENEVFL